MTTNTNPQPQPTLKERVAEVQKAIRSFSAATSMENKCSKLLTDLLAEVERLNQRLNFHRDLGITLLDAKYLDPECHTGCQSLKWQAELAAARAEALEVEEIHENEIRMLKAKLEDAERKNTASVAVYNSLFDEAKKMQARLAQFEGAEVLTLDDVFNTEDGTGLPNVTINEGDRVFIVRAKKEDGK